MNENKLYIFFYLYYDCFPLKKTEQECLVMVACSIPKKMCLNSLLQPRNPRQRSTRKYLLSLQLINCLKQSKQSNSGLDPCWAISYSKPCKTFGACFQELSSSYYIICEEFPGYMPQSEFVGAEHFVPQCIHCNSKMPQEARMLCHKPTIHPEQQS